MSQSGLSVRCWGTRGSLPSPGADTVVYGGNTSCVEVVTPGGERLIFDAGSGIRPLGDHLAVAGTALRADLFLTHFHWDHIQGLPFFRPIYDAASAVCVHGAAQGGVGAEALIAGQMGPIYFPVPFDAVAASLQVSELTDEPVVRGDAVITAHRTRHPNDTFGYRVDAGGCAVAYVPDNELVGGDYAVGPGWAASMRRFLEGVDVLYHDAMFTDAEYERYTGWGHSSISQAIALAESAGVRRLCLFHHAPGRTDAELSCIVADAQEQLVRRGSPLVLDGAAEGNTLVVGGTK